MFKDNIFRSYDIRGLYSKEFDEEFAKELGKAVAVFLKNDKNEIVVGRDVRIGSESLAKALIEGITDMGVDVLDIGITTTPITFFASSYLGKCGSVMVTASHLPPEYNGFKILDSDGTMIGKEAGLLKIKEIIENGLEKSNERGIVRKYDKILDDYENFVLPKINIARKMKIVIDPANSVGSIVAPRIFEKAGCEVVVINGELDGTFPSRPSEPKAENIQSLKETVVKENADIGMAFDGDCDRILFVDNNGNVIESSSSIIMMFAEHYLKDNRGAHITFDLGCSMALEEMIKKNGGVPEETKVGTSHIKADMKKNNSIIGGESSNHMYFSDIYNFDDAIFAGLKMTEIISKSNTTLSEKIKSFPSYYYLPELEFECEDSKKEIVMKKIKDKFKQSGLRFSELDGFKLYYDDGWVLWRSSGTSPCMRIYIEAKEKERLEELKEFARIELEKAMG